MEPQEIPPSLPLIWLTDLFWAKALTAAIDQGSDVTQRYKLINVIANVFVQNIIMFNITANVGELLITKLIDLIFNAGLKA